MYIYPVLSFINEVNAVIITGSMTSHKLQPAKDVTSSLAKPLQLESIERVHFGEIGASSDTVFMHVGANYRYV